MTNEPEIKKELEHKITRFRLPGSNDWRVECSCGASWTHKKDETEEKIESIFQSHLRYFNRPKMEPM